jgi:hypothetical protein
MSMIIGHVETNYGDAEILVCHYGGPDGPIAVRLDLLDGEIFVKTWSENAGWFKKVLDTGLFEDTGKRVPTGFVEAQIWRFTNRQAEVQPCG